MVKRKNYLFQLKNERFKKFVQETKIEELEELIENYLQQVKKIKTNQRKVNVKNDLPSTIPQVKKEVLAILGVEGEEKKNIFFLGKKKFFIFCCFGVIFSPKKKIFFFFKKKFFFFFSPLLY